MGSHRDSRQTTVEAVVQTRKSTGAISYFAKSNTTELVKMTSTATSDRSGRIPDLKTTTSVSSSTSSATSTGTQESSLLVSKHPLLCSLLSSPPPAAGGHTQKAAEPGGWRRRRLEESGVETKHKPITIYSLVGTLRHYGRVIWQ